MARSALGRRQGSFAAGAFRRCGSRRVRVVATLAGGAGFGGLVGAALAAARTASTARRGILFAFVVTRALLGAVREPEPNNRLAIVGLGLMFGLQALINMGVNVGLLPAKGMTLPFISAGGSSMLAVSLTLGMMLALTRQRADHDRLKKPRLTTSLDTFGLAGETRK